MCVPIINNGNFGYGRNQSIRINNQFFGHELMDRYGIALRALRWNDCTVNGAFVPIRQFNEHIGIPFTREQYYDLKTSYAVRHSTAISYPSIENSFNGCQGHPLVCLPPGTAQRQPDRIKKGSNAQQFIQLSVVGDINAESG
jgi:hypothetical protein